MSAAKKRIVVVGGGFGGLRAALSLDKGLRENQLADTYEVVLIDNDDYQIYTPLLYKFAVDPKFPREAVAYPFRKLLFGTSIKFLQATAQKINPAGGAIHFLNGEELKYDLLVLDPGSEVNYFGIPGLAEISLPLKTYKDAEKIREKLVALPALPSAGRAAARVVVGGGGPTGVELAAEIKLARGFQVTLIEAMPELLPGMHPRAGKIAERRLRKLGVDVLLGSPIMQVGSVQINLQNGGQIPFDLLIWTGGVKTPAWIKDLPLATENRGKLEVMQDMECKPANADLSLGARVYAIGDAVCVYDENGKPLPQTARVAMEEAEVVAQNILNALVGQPHVKYHPVHYPYVVPIGGAYAVANIGSFVFSGLAAHIFKLLVEVYYRASIMPFWDAIRLPR